MEITIVSFLKQYLSIESDNQDVENESEEAQTSEETEQATEEAAEEQARQEQQEQMEGETVEEAVNIDDSDTPATGGTRLDHYRRLAAERNAEANDEEAAPAEETEENTEEETTAEETGDNAENNETQTEEENNASEEEEKGEDGEGKTETEEADEEDKSKAVDSLEALRDEIMISYQKGGMNEAEASIVNTAIESILFSAGVTGVDRIVSSIECFSENSTRRLLATSLTIDNLNMVIDTLRGK